MHVVTENSPETLRERELLNRLTWALRELTANLMRISRGAGKPVSVVVQSAEVVSIVREYEDLTGHGAPVETVSEALSVRVDWEVLFNLPEDERKRRRVNERVIAGALQVAASRLLDQKTHATRGDDEMFEGMQRIQEVREERIKARQAAVRLQKKPKTAAKKKTPIGP